MLQKNKTIGLGLALGVCVAVIGCKGNEPVSEQNLVSDNGMPSSEVIIQAKSGSDVSGKIRLVQENDRLKVVGKFSGLEPNSEHGFHIHEKGDCSAKDGKSAGGHFAPQDHKHGAPYSKSHHAGDLGNVKANDKGIATIEKSFMNINIDKDNKFNINGKAFVLHNKADDFKSQPSGAAGKRIGCGVIPKS